jgi:single-strand DNA-binding protein
MANFNKVVLIGNLTRDPEVRSTPSGQSVTALGMAINRTYMVGGQGGQGGEKREETTFVDVDMWGRRGEVIAQYLKKGDPIFIEGRLTFRQWDDKEGNKRSKLSVTAENFEFLGGRKGDRPGASTQHEPSEQSSGGGGNDRNEMSAGLDEVPF